MTSQSARRQAAGAARTYQPTAHAESVSQRFAEQLAELRSTSAVRPALVGPQNEEIPVPEEAFDVLVQVVEAMRQGLAIHVAPLNTQLTTQEAANYLGISRPTFVKLLEEGRLPFTKPGRHRYVQLVDVVEYSESVRTARSEALDALAREAEEVDLYDQLDRPPPPMR